MGIGGKLQLEEGTAGGTFVGFKAPDTEVTNDLIWTLPSSDGTAGQLFGTDGSKNIVWVSNLDSSLQAAITTEATTRASVDSLLQLSDSSLQAAVNSEYSSRILSDSSLQSALYTEITARFTADSSLQSGVVTTGAQSFTGVKTFNTGLINNGPTTLDVTETTGNICSGTYIPSVGFVGGSDSGVTLTANGSRWMRVGNVVTISGQVTIDPAATGYNEIYMTLPTDGGSGNFSVWTQGSGVCYCHQMNTTGSVLSRAGYRQLLLCYFPADVSARGWTFTAQYDVV